MDQTSSDNSSKTMRTIVCGSYNVTLVDTGNGIYKALYKHIENHEKIQSTNDRGGEEEKNQDGKMQDGCREESNESMHPENEIETYKSDKPNIKERHEVRPGAVLVRNDLPCNLFVNPGSAIIPTADVVDENSAKENSLVFSIPVDNISGEFEVIVVEKGQIETGDNGDQERTEMSATTNRSKYELQCSNEDCQKIFKISINKRNRHLQEYLTAGILIRCSICCDVGKASIQLTEKESSGKSEEAPLFVCSESNCSRFCSSLQGLEFHREVIHSERNGTPAAIEAPRVAPSSIKISGNNCQSWTENSAYSGENLKLGYEDGAKLRCTSSCSSPKIVVQEKTETDVKQMEPSQKSRRVIRNKTYEQNLQKSEINCCRHASCTEKFESEEEMLEHEKYHARKGHSAKDCKCSGCTNAKRKPPNTAPVGNHYRLVCGACDAVYVYVCKKASTWREQYEETGINIMCNNCDNVTKSPFVLFAQDETYDSNQPTFPCPEEKCQKVFATIPELRRHQKCHSTESVTCEYCQGQIKNRQSMKHHRPLCPGRINQCSCDICGKVQNNEHHLLLHMRRAHPKVSKLCEECGASFKNSANLKRHCLIHLPPEQRPSEIQTCELCLKVFSSKANLMHHMHRTHKPKDKSCDICGKMFKTMLQLNRHRLTHDSLKNSRKHGCSRCAKKFIAKRELDEHIRRVHECIRDFCGICQKAFRSSLGFKQHMKSHSSLERSVYSCAGCGKLYQSLLGLKLHNKKCGVA